MQKLHMEIKFKTITAPLIFTFKSSPKTKHGHKPL